MVAEALVDEAVEKGIKRKKREASQKSLLQSAP